MNTKLILDEMKTILDGDFSVDSNFKLMKLARLSSRAEYATADLILTMSTTRFNLNYCGANTSGSGGYGVSGTKDTDRNQKIGDSQESPFSWLSNQGDQAQPENKEINMNKWQIILFIAAIVTPGGFLIVSLYAAYKTKFK